MVERVRIRPDADSLGDGTYFALTVERVRKLEVRIVLLYEQETQHNAWLVCFV